MQQDDRNAGRAAGARGESRGWTSPAVLAIAAILVLVEAVLDGNALGLWGAHADWRTVAIAFAGFWAGLLDNWQPNYPGQPVAMFLTYAFLHSGPVHLAVNLVTLLSLGGAVVERAGQGRFLVVYLGSALGGGLFFAFLLPSPQPMVGASGALFGLFGALLAWDYAGRAGRPDRFGHLLRIVALLAVLNAALWWATQGLLAWQTHLGGFVFGWLIALALSPRSS